MVAGVGHGTVGFCICRRRSAAARVPQSTDSRRCRDGPLAAAAHGSNGGSVAAQPELWPGKQDHEPIGERCCSGCAAYESPREVRDGRRAHGSEFVAGFTADR